MPDECLMRLRAPARQERPGRACLDLLPAGGEVLLIIGKPEDILRLVP